MNTCAKCGSEIGPFIRAADSEDPYVCLCHLSKLDVLLLANLNSTTAPVIEGILRNR